MQVTIIKEEFPIFLKVKCLSHIFYFEMTFYQLHCVINNGYLISNIDSLELPNRIHRIDEVKSYHDSVSQGYNDNKKNVFQRN